MSRDKNRFIFIKSSSNKPQALWGNKDTVSLFIAVVLWAIPMPIGHERIVLVVRMILVALALLHPLFQLPWIIRAKTKLGKVSVATATIAGMLVVLFFYTWLIWPPAKRHTLSAKEKENFERPLKGKQSPEMSIQLACAPNDEVDCEYAAELIPLFGEAGWKISGEVERIALIRPMPGITLGLKGGKPEEERNWNSGAWMSLTPTLEHVRQAFVNIGIEPSSTSGSIIPENQINIYVGHEREDESAPTDLTRGFEQMYKFRREELPKIRGAK